MDKKMSPRYTQVMIVSVYSSLTAVNQASLEWRILEITDYECDKTYPSIIRPACGGKWQITHLSEPEP